MSMGFHEDDRIRRKNKEYNKPTKLVPILSPVGDTDDKENTDISSNYVTDGDAAAKRACQNRNRRGD